MLFLEADEQTLQTRYKETRRRHPLAPDRQRRRGDRRERELLAPLRSRADVVIDTDRADRGDAAAQARRRAAAHRTPGRLAVTFESFGFKYGPVRDPDLMFDVRFLPNPHYEPELRPLTGDDSRVRRVHQPGRRARRVLRAAAPAARLPAAAVPGRGQGAPGGGASAAPAAATARWRSPSTWPSATGPRTSTSSRSIHRDIERAGVIDHVGFEVVRSGAVGARSTTRCSSRWARGGCSSPSTPSPTASTVPCSGSSTRGRAPAPGYGHVALHASGKAAVDAAYRAGLANGGSRRRGSRTAAAVRRAATTPATCSIPTGCGSRSSRAGESPARGR